MRFRSAGGLPGAALVRVLLLAALATLGIAVPASSAAQTATSSAAQTSSSPTPTTTVAAVAGEDERQVGDEGRLAVGQIPQPLPSAGSAGLDFLWLSGFGLVLVGLTALVAPVLIRGRRGE